jgi:prepilin-type N-terminal cleavage/methylation domain-containing protein
MRMALAQGIWPILSNPLIVPISLGFAGEFTLTNTKFSLDGSAGKAFNLLMKPSRRPRRGFTLVEVMILLVIIALLLAMAIPALQKIRQAKQDHAPVPAPATATPAP